MKKTQHVCAHFWRLTMGLGSLSGCTGAPASSAPAQAASVSAPASGAPAGKPGHVRSRHPDDVPDRRPSGGQRRGVRKDQRTLKAEINATIDVKFMSWGEYEQKYPLIFASGEDWDIILYRGLVLLQRAGHKAGLLGDHARSAGDLCAHDGRQHVSRSVGTGEGGRQGLHAAHELQETYRLCLSGARRPDGQIRYRIRGHL